MGASADTEVEGRGALIRGGYWGIAKLGNCSGGF